MEAAVPARRLEHEHGYPFEPNRTTPHQLVLGFVIVLAWGLLAAWQNSAFVDLLGHEALEDHHLSFGWHLAAFLLSWLLMTVAMMLPGSLPMLIHSVQPVRRPTQDTRPVASVILGYLAPWVGFGLLIYLGDSELHHLAEPGARLATFSAWIAPTILLTSGVYQLTPLKRRSIALCRPLPAMSLHRSEEYISDTAAWKRGLRLGIYCIGSCWSLMLLMFALGHHRLDIMLALSVILAAERLTPWGHRLALVVGAVLVAGSVAWILAA